MSDRDKAFGYAVSKWGTSNTPARENLAFADGWKAALDWTLTTPSPIADQAVGEPIAEIINVYGDPEAFAERAVVIIGNAYQSLPIGTKLYARSTAPTTGSAPAGNTITCPHYGACSMEICLQENACTLRRPATPASPAASVLTASAVAGALSEYGRKDPSSTATPAFDDLRSAIASALSLPAPNSRSIQLLSAIVRAVESGEDTKLILDENSPLMDEIRTLLATNQINHMSASDTLLGATKAFYNATIADTSVIVRAPSAEKRDNIKRLSDELRAVLLAASMGGDKS